MDRLAECHQETHRSERQTCKSQNLTSPLVANFPPLQILMKPQLAQTERCHTTDLTVALPRVMRMQG